MARSHVYFWSQVARSGAEWRGDLLFPLRRHFSYFGASGALIVGVLFTVLDCIVVLSEVLQSKARVTGLVST